MYKNLFLLLITITITIIHGSVFNPSKYYGPRFSESRLYLLEGQYSLHLEELNAHVVAFGDFNSDLKTDIFVLSSNRSVLSVYIWDTYTFSFKALDSVITLPYITNVVPGDFNYDGKLDVLIASITGNTTTLFIYYGMLNNFGTKTEIRNVANGQILVFDANNDLRLDLFATTTDLKRSYLISSKDTDPTVTFNTYNQDNNADGYPLSPAHAQGFFDFDGDCLADLFVVSQKCSASTCTYYFEFWHNEKLGATGAFSFVNRIQVPDGNLGQPSFTDINGDGTIDILFTLSTNNGDSLYAMYNQQIPMCRSAFLRENGCRAQDDLCAPDKNYKFSDPVQLKLGTQLNDKQFWFGDIDGDGIIEPPILRTGDFNLDGYPDFLAIMVSGTDKTQQAVLWINTPCSGCDASSTRTFDIKTIGTDALSNIKNPIAATFMDFDEAGWLDIIVLTYTPNNNTKPYGIVGLFNNINSDAFFLKTLGLNGVCYYCTDTTRPYGVNMPGNSFKFTVSDFTGTKRPLMGGQLSTSSHLSLQTPYVMFGLGRPSNYIEELFMGVTYSATTKDRHWNMWVSIIPNSQLVAIPYPPDTPSNWQIELFVSPTEKALWVFVSIVSWLAVIGALILFFDRRERKQDELERKEKEPYFSFAAL